MFKFGKYARPKGPYDVYKDPVNKIIGRGSAQAVTSSSRRSKVTSDFGSGFGSSSSGPSSGSNAGASFNGPSSAGAGGAAIGGGSPGFNSNRFNPVFDTLEEGSVLEDWIPQDGAGMDLMFRRIYLRDPTIGPGIDLIKSLPWSEFSLDGIEDDKIREIYEDSMNAMQIQSLMPEITGDFLILGRDILSLIFDDRKGIFKGVVPHDPDFIKLTPIPVAGYDPLCDLTLSPGFKAFINSDDPRVLDAKKTLPSQLLQAVATGQQLFPLDPISTIYLARRASSHDYLGTSILTRVLYFWAIEKALLNAQLTSVRRRARSFMQMKVGIDNLWEPTPEEIDALAAMAIQVNEDPVGGVIATRTGVDISEPVGGGADFYKWSDELELFAKYKMQAIGINDALLNGDSTYNNSDQARSVFVETLANLRSKLVHKMFTTKIFPTLARVHGFVKRSKAELDHRIRTTSTSSLPAYTNKYPVTAEQNQRLTQRKLMETPVSDLIIPTINWQKQLKPNQDDKALEIFEKLKQNEVETPLSNWLNAAGLDQKSYEKAMQDSFEVKGRVAKLKQELDALESGTSENVEDLTAPEEEEVKQSLYARAATIGKGTAKNLTDISIWDNKRCGPLSLVEASKFVIAFLKDKNPAILGDQRAIMNEVSSKLGGQKAPIMFYVLNRLGLAKLPIDKQTAAVIMNSAKNNAVKTGSPTSEKALLTMRKYQSEIKHVQTVLGMKLKGAMPEVKMTNMGSNLYSGVDEPVNT